jgi:galactokinase
VVITNSLTPHALTDSAPEQYNLRVVEGLIAARLLARSWGLGELTGVNDKRIWFKEVLGAYGEKEGISDEMGLLKRGMEEVKRVLGVEGRDKIGWTREQMVEASGLSEEEFKSLYLDFLESTSPHPLFPLVLS